MGSEQSIRQIEDDVTLGVTVCGILSMSMWSDFEWCKNVAEDIARNWCSADIITPAHGL
jgi:hypothetical protein